MPYIAAPLRPALDKIVLAMEMYNENNGIQANGDLNYILYSYCVRNISPSYGCYKNFIGELVECAAEIRRRLLVPHEKNKIEVNGDIP